MSENNSIISFGDFGPAAKAFVEMVDKHLSGAIGPYYAKWQAEADASIARTQADSKIEITDLERRAANRWLSEEAWKQRNMEQIASRAIPMLSERAQPEGMKEDWVANFFEKCRITSDGEIQSRWARLLAGEANAPGSYSARSVNTLAEMDKTDAELFTTLCRYCWTIRGKVPVIHTPNGYAEPKKAVYEKLYATLYATPGIMSHLETIGLIQLHPQTTFSLKDVANHTVAHYFDKSFEMEFGKETGTVLYGYVAFTRVGQQLSNLCNCTPIEGMFEYMRDTMFGSISRRSK